MSEYFKGDDKKSAEELVKSIQTEYLKTIESSTWMDQSTKEEAIRTTNNMEPYIGYHVQLLENETQTFYDMLPELDEAEFLEMGMAFVVFTADREYRRLNTGKKKDWSK